MEAVAGYSLIVLGLLIGIFGSAPPSRRAGERALSVWQWLDTLVRWTIGIACLWFGVSLLLGHAHYF